METLYENENLAIRLVTFTNSTENKIKISAYKRLLEVTKQLGWTT